MPTWKDVIKKKLSRSDWLLIVANLIPVYGVWFQNWSAREVFLVYCLETIIVGFFTLLKLLIAGFVKKKDDWQNQGSVTKQPFWFFMLFFMVHYGMFVAIQMGLFFAVSGIGAETNITVFNFFYKWPTLITNEAYIMLGAFMLSYGFKHVTEFVLSGEYRTASLSYLMFQPYGRIFIQQVTVIIGSMFLTFGAGKIFILIFSAVKIFMEVLVSFDTIISSTLKEAAGKKTGSTE